MKQLMVVALLLTLCVVAGQAQYSKWIQGHIDHSTGWDSTFLSKTGVTAIIYVDMHIYSPTDTLQVAINDDTTSTNIYNVYPGSDGSTFLTPEYRNVRYFRTRGKTAQVIAPTGAWIK